MSDAGSVPPRRNISRLLLVGGLVLMAATVVFVVVAVTTAADWAFIAAGAAFVAALVCVGQSIAPGASNFRGGTKSWQNEGPGTGAGFGGGAA